MVSCLYSLMDLVWQKVQKKAAIMPAPERGVSSRLRFNIGASDGEHRREGMTIGKFIPTCS